MFGLQAAGLAAHLHRRNASRVIDPEIGLGERLHRLNDALPLVILDPASTQPLLIDTGIHREQTLYQLLFTHFKTENSNRLLVPYRGIVSQT